MQRNFSFIFLFLLLFVSNTKAQNQNSFESDTSLFFKTLKSDNYGKESNAVAKSLISNFTIKYGKNSKEAGIAYHCSGLSYKQFNNIDSAIIQFKKAYEIHFNRNFTDFCKTERQLSICYFDRGEWQNSLHMQEESIEYIKEHVFKNSDTLRIAYNSIGIVNSKLANYTKSYDFCCV